MPCCHYLLVSPSAPRSCMHVTPLTCIQCILRKFSFSFPPPLPNLLAFFLVGWYRLEVLASHFWTAYFYDSSLYVLEKWGWIGGWDPRGDIGLMSIQELAAYVYICRHYVVLIILIYYASVCMKFNGCLYCKCKNPTHLIWNHADWIWFAAASLNPLSLHALSPLHIMRCMKRPTEEPK